MVTCDIEWNGTSCRDVGLHGVVVDGWPSVTLPEKDIEEYDVPGRDYPYLVDSGCYKPYTQKYTIHWRTPDGQAVASWLSNPTGWCKLIDSRNPQRYRLAYYKGGFSVTDKIMVLGVATIEFVCQPYYYVDQTLIDLNNTDITYEKELSESDVGTTSVAYPNITVYGGIEWQTLTNPFKVYTGYKDAAGVIQYDHELDVYPSENTTGGYIYIYCADLEAAVCSYDGSDLEKAKAEMKSGSVWCPLGLYNDQVYRFMKFECDLGFWGQWKLTVDIKRRTLL